MSAVVVDASVALRWLTEQTETASLFDLLKTEFLHAPDFLQVEVANGLWAKVRRQLVTRQGAEDLYERFLDLPIALTPASELLQRARTAAFAFDLTVCDALYVALAESRLFPLATVDQGMARALRAGGRADLLWPL